MIIMLSTRVFLYFFLSFSFFLILSVSVQKFKMYAFFLQSETHFCQLHCIFALIEFFNTLATFLLVNTLILWRELRFWSLLNSQDKVTALTLWTLGILGRLLRLLCLPLRSWDPSVVLENLDTLQTHIPRNSNQKIPANGVSYQTKPCLSYFLKPQILSCWS